jgi:excisionase family DNA binding protein
MEEATMLHDGPLALRPRDAAKVLNISERHLWQLTKDGIVPCVRIGLGTRKIVRYPTHDLRAWLSQQAATAKGNEDVSE